jgi:hypothetical protein
MTVAQALLSYKALEVLGTIVCVITASAFVCMMMPMNNNVEGNEGNEE